MGNQIQRAYSGLADAVRGFREEDQSARDAIGSVAKELRSIAKQVNVRLGRSDSAKLAIFVIGHDTQFTGIDIDGSNRQLVTRYSGYSKTVLMQEHYGEYSRAMRYAANRAEDLRSVVRRSEIGGMNGLGSEEARRNEAHEMHAQAEKLKEQFAKDWTGVSATLKLDRSEQEILLRRLDFSLAIPDGDDGGVRFHSVGVARLLQS